MKISLPILDFQIHAAFQVKYSGFASMQLAVHHSLMKHSCLHTSVVNVDREKVSCFLVSVLGLVSCVPAR